MRKGSVIRYAGKRGVVWRLRYRDASGKRANETLGSELDGWTKTSAEEALNERLVAVKREGFRKITSEAPTFGQFARQWLETYPAAKGLKRSTREGYDSIIERHLIPAFGDSRLDALEPRQFDQYVSKKLGGKEPLAARTVNHHLNLLNKLLGAAVKGQLIKVNPVQYVERPKEPRRRWAILSPLEVFATERGFRELIEASIGEERAWRVQARLIFLVVYGLGLRRGEVLGLRWRDVDHADPEGAVLRVRETWVRSAIDSPKSEAGERTIPLDEVLAEELWQHRRRTPFSGDDERVFCSPSKGTPFDVTRYAETFRAALKRAKIDRYVRPFHDGRHSNITNAAAAGVEPAKLMALAGHSDYKTTQGYIDLAGQTFREDAALVQRRILGGIGQKSGQNEANDAATAEAAETDVWLNGAAPESNRPSRGLHDRTGFEDLPTEDVPGQSGAIRRPSVGLGHVRSAEAGKSRGKS